MPCIWARIRKGTRGCAQVIDNLKWSRSNKGLRVYLNWNLLAIAGIGSCFAAAIYEVGRPKRLSSNEAMELESQWQDFGTWLCPCVALFVGSVPS